MNSSTKILKIKNGNFYYTENDYVNIKDTNIPSEKMSINYSRDIYWEVELFDYDIESETIKVRVVDYTPEYTINFYQQKQKRPVKFFQFEKFEWLKIEPQLISYVRKALSEIMDFPSSLEEKLGISNVKTEPFTEGANIGLVRNQVDKISEHFSVYYKDANFNDGYVMVDFKSELCSQKTKIKINNRNILPEYDHIKYYFPKYFKNGKKFKVKLDGEIQFGKLVDYNASSSEIESIDEEVISAVKDLLNVELFDKIDSETVEMNILSIQELTEESSLGQNVKKYVDEDPQKILGSIMKIMNVKNKKQLEYLAGFKQENEYQLRFTLKPVFGFLFYVKNDEGNHFCWELLDSHATYIWSFNSKVDFSEQLNTLDSIINYIKINGREKYKRLIKTEEDKDCTFSTIYHKYKMTNGFVAWKTEFEQLINKIS